MQKIALAQLPTPIYQTQRFFDGFEQNVYLKRDDLTGTEVSGNKIRKLEYAVAEAVAQGCDTLITCGGVQSNHCRATAAVGARLGMKVHLLLRDQGEPKHEGNCLLDQLFGAEISYLSPEAYADKETHVSRIQKTLLEEGHQGYWIPTGASNGIGSLGYIDAMAEIEAQEEALGIHFDTIITTVGSGGTYAGLFYGNLFMKQPRKVVGINICETADYFKKEIIKIIEDLKNYPGMNKQYDEGDITLIDGFGGLGYGLSQSRELAFIQRFAKQEGILLDPVYTGKAMYGLYETLKKGGLKDSQNILFIHTGGSFGLFPKATLFKWD